MTDQPFDRPAGFDLEAAWAERTATLRPPEKIRVNVVVDTGPEGAQFLRFAAWHIVEAGEDGQVMLEFASAGAAAAFIASFDDAVQVLDPPQVQERLAAIGRALLARYGDA